MPVIRHSEAACVGVAVLFSAKGRFCGVRSNGVCGCAELVCIFSLPAGTTRAALQHGCSTGEEAAFFVFSAGGACPGTPEKRPALMAAESLCREAGCRPDFCLADA